MRIRANSASGARRHQPVEQVILFTVAEQLFAIASNAVHEIRSTDSLSAAASDIAQQEVKKVCHTLRRERRAYYVVNAAAHFGLPATRPTLVLVLRDFRVAVLVDRIERMESISLLQPLPQAFCGAERQWYRGLVLLDNVVVPVVNPAGFLNPQEMTLLDAAVGSRANAERFGAPGEVMP